MPTCPLTEDPEQGGLWAGLGRTGPARHTHNTLNSDGAAHRLATSPHRVPALLDAARGGCPRSGPVSQSFSRAVFFLMLSLLFCSRLLEATGNKSEH